MPTLLFLSCSHHPLSLGSEEDSNLAYPKQEPSGCSDYRDSIFTIALPERLIGKWANEGAMNIKPALWGPHTANKRENTSGRRYRGKEQPAAAHIKDLGTACLTPGTDGARQALAMHPSQMYVARRGDQSQLCTMRAPQQEPTNSLSICQPARILLLTEDIASET